MEQAEFRALCEKKPVILDGASGTQMHAGGMPGGVCPELYAIENPTVLQSFQREYYEAGADIVYTFTFGGNRSKLAHYGVGQDQVHEVNKKLAEITCQVRDEMRVKYPERTFLAAGDIAPTGRFLAPAGDMTPDELTEIYKEQAMGLEDGGVDLFVIETMMDLDQVRYAVLAIRQVSSLPVMATLTFDKGKTLSGNTPLEGLITLDALGVCAFGANCSTGPEAMKELLAPIIKLSSIPVIAKPNAGMPHQVDGKTVFPMQAEEFGEKSVELYQAGISVFGGCCGTTPAHIGKLAGKISGLPSNFSECRDCSFSATASMICSAKTSVKITPDTSIQYVSCGDPENLQDDVLDACDESPDCVVIDVTAYETAADFDMDALTEAITMTGFMTPVPLGIKTNSEKVLDAVAGIYCGRLAFTTDLDSAGVFEQIVRKYGIYTLK